MAFHRLWVGGVFASFALVWGCGGSSCPEGTVETAGRCISPSDAGPGDSGASNDAGMLDAFVVFGVDAPLPDVFVPMGVDAGELPDVFVELPDSFVPDACTPSTFYVDGDGDGHGDAAMTVTGCVLPSGAALLGDDCNDGAMSVHPGATEACDGFDQDCDSRLDEGSGPIAAFYPDADGDGHGVIGGASVMACAAPPGRAALADDCNDAANTIYPGATELCNGVDEDCDTGVDEGIQRLLRTPHEVVPAGGADYDLAYAAPLVDGYAVVYQTPAGAVVRRVRRDGTLVGTARTVTSSTAEGPTVVATGPTRVAVFYSRSISGITYSLHGVSVDFGTEPATVSSEVTVAATSNTLGPQATVLEGRVIVTWVTSSMQLARTYALDLTDPSTVTTLAPFSMDRPVFLAGEGASWLAYSGQRPATPRVDCYAQRVTVVPLAVDADVTTLGDGSGACSLYLAATRTGQAQALLVYGGGARSEMANLTFTTTARVTRRAGLTLPTPYGAALQGWAGSAGGYDLAVSTAPGAPAALGQWLHTAASGTTSTAASFGGSQAIASFTATRSSSQHGAMFYVATPTGGSTHGLWMQEMGCE